MLIGVRLHALGNKLVISSIRVLLFTIRSAWQSTVVGSFLPGERKGGSRSVVW